MTGVRVGQPFTQQGDHMTTALVAATDRPSLDRAHGDVNAWIRERLDRITVELIDARKSLATARERKWGTDALARQVRSLEKHEAFLVKVNAAIAAGYAIVPNFQVEKLAVRTDKAPEGASRYLEHRPVVGAARLPIGRGEFVAPEPEFSSWQETRKRTHNNKEEDYQVTIFNTTQHAPVDVPIALMKRELADSLHEAMEGKLFDELGVVRDAPRGDPILVGRILHPKGRSWRWGVMDRGVTFFIGWWFDLSTLDA